MIDPILDSAPCGFLIFEDSGQIKTANHTLVKLLGFTLAELQARKFDDLVGIAGKIFCQTHLFPLIRLQGAAQEIFLTLKTKGKEDVPMLLNMERKPVDDGAFEIHCVLLPVYQRKKYETELLRIKRQAEDATARKEQEQTFDLENIHINLDLQLTRLSVMHESLIKFGKVISHDTQEPMRKIAIFANTLEHREASLSDSAKHAVGRIQASAARLRTLMACLEEYLAVDIHEKVGVVVDLVDIIKAAQKRCMPLPDDVALHIGFSGGLPPVSCYPRQIENLFFHLINNSIKFRKTGSEAVEINISLDIIQQNSYKTMSEKYRYVDYAQIIFKDDGSGFEADQHDYIFQLFTKAHDQSGTGFGLALCKKIIENHSGSITANAKPGEGATFTILLPFNTFSMPGDVLAG